MIMVAGCSSPKFNIEFQLPTSINSTYPLTYYASSPKQGKWISSAIVVQQGKGKMTFPVSDPAVVTLTAAGSTLYFYVERGDKVMVKGDSADPSSWVFSGNSINEDWSKWRKENSSQIAGGNAEKINSAVDKFVKKNPSNPLSALLLLYEYDRRINNEGFLKLWKSLKGEAAKEKWITISGRSDLYTNIPLEPVNVKRKHSIPLHSLVNGTDTIVTGKVPVVLMVWRNGDREREEFIDSLRALRKAHPDSASFIIADICFDPDSINWAAPLGRDSLEHIIRAWNPVAEADSVMRSLGIERTPMIITIPPLNK